MYLFRMQIINNIINIETNIPKIVGKEKYTYYCSARNIDAGGEGYEVIKRNHGIGVRETEDYVEVFNDPYCSIPVFIYKDGEGIRISSLFEELVIPSLTIDKVGVYETMLYESALHDRTMFEEIKQLPAACKIRINKKTYEYIIIPYWDFDIIENSSVTSEEAAVELVWKVLKESFAMCPDKTKVMGVSGGLDSRLSVCIMNAQEQLEDIRLFTFGHNKHILDYKLAKQFCQKIKKGLDPEFIKLQGATYLESMDLPIKTGYGVGINHSHAYWCLKQMDVKDRVLISNYYSDAVMGYDCIELDYEDTVENCAYYKKLLNNELKMEESIREEIEKDIRKITDRRKVDANFSCYDEFIYLVERNPKFHIRLSYLYSELLDVYLPYAEYNVLATMLSLPLKYRYRKRIEHLILRDKFEEMRDISSVRYGGVERKESNKIKKIQLNLGFFLMRGINLVNSVLCVLIGGRIQIPNKYITENHLAVINRYFGEYQISASSELYECGLLTKELREKYKVRCKRTADAHNVFSLIGIWTILSSVEQQ